MNNMYTECVGSIHEEDDKITDYSVKERELYTQMGS